MTTNAPLISTTPTTRPRKVLVVSAHPEADSLTASLADFAVQRLRGAGHEVRVSDLYAMKWKAVVDADDFPDHPPRDSGGVLAAAGEATLAGRLSPDVAAEQEKLVWADAVVLQFPLWWFSVPAILKGWMDRVFTFGFSHGPEFTPFGGGGLGGRRALLAVTAGAREPAFSDRGINGPLADVLYPVQHGLLWLTGIQPMEPFAVFDANGLSEERYAEALETYGRRLDGLFTDEPVPFRSLAGGDYDHGMRLLPGREEPGTSGMALHTARPASSAADRLAG
ncbi:NAD(P)H-dependent oxidoreductase [Streptomyces sp. NPDC046887]|uniref:NAD(P)H-dependent oxidoreductase n=1 Tax=Streptomyces sp. NPDC046887 TaxID=3155472 RepID=UPI0033E0C8FB